VLHQPDPAQTVCIPALALSIVFFKKNNKTNKYTLFRTKSNHNASHLLSSKDRRDLNFFSFIALLNRLLKWVLFFAFGGNGKIISFLLGNAGIVPGFFLKL